jgi:hypothetical protein
LKKRLFAYLDRFQHIGRKPSLMAVIFSVAFAYWLVDFWRPYNREKNDNNFVWDMFGYYSYLPAQFCNGGSFDWHGQHMTFLGNSPLGNPFPKYTYGVAFLQSPFFFLGYKVAYNQHDPLDGFSEGFSTCVHWSTMIYVFIGLLYLRKFLLSWFNEKVVAITIAATLFGSMLFMYSFIQAELSHGYLFALFCIFLYYTQRWYDHPKLFYLVMVGLTGGLATLIRPTEIFVWVFFIFYRVFSWHDIKQRIRFFVSKPRVLLLLFFLCILWWIPQFLFWKKYAGSYFFFSYQDEKFFWSDPQIMNILFSYRKGWITYTPLVLLSLIGIFFMRRKTAFSPWLIFAVVSIMTYVYSCWWDWNYGGCFANRAFCNHIAYLAIPLSSLIQFLFYSEKKFFLRGWFSLIASAFVFSCIFLNLGQSYQYQQLRKIHPWAMSKTIYWNVFRTYQYSDAYNYQFFADLEYPDHDNWMKGIGRDDKKIIKK